MISYCCANQLNIGDYFSMLGVKEAVGLEGSETVIEGKHRGLSQMLEQFGPEDHLIIGGGGLMMNFFAPFWETALNKQRQNKFNMHLFGVGVCDHKFSNDSTVLDAGLLRNIHAQASSLYLRPPLPLRDSRVQSVFCPSMSFVRKNYSSARSDAETLLFVSHPSLTGSNNDQTLRRVLSSYCDDNLMNFSVVDNIAHTAEERQDIMRRYETATNIVTTRLHGYIIGNSLQKPTTAISFDQKLEGFAQMLGDSPPISPAGMQAKHLLQGIAQSRPLSTARLSQIVDSIQLAGMEIRRTIQQ